MFTMPLNDIVIILFMLLFLYAYYGLHIHAYVYGKEYDQFLHYFNNKRIGSMKSKSNIHFIDTPLNITILEEKCNGTDNNILILIENSKLIPNMITKQEEFKRHYLKRCSIKTFRILSSGISDSIISFRSPSGTLSFNASMISSFQ